MNCGFSLLSPLHVCNRFRIWLASPSNSTVLLTVITLGHVSGMFTYGATFWVDSTAYVYFAQIFNSVKTAKEILLNPDFLIYSHIGWGEPYLWFLLTKLPMEWAWPVMAAGKHIFGIVALVYLFSTVNKIFPSQIHLIIAALVSFLPFYQAMHNVLMTESVATNCILIVLAAALKIYYNYDAGCIIDNTSLIDKFTWFNRHRPWIIFIIASCISIQFRSLFIIFPFSFMLILFVKKLSLSHAAVLAGIFAMLLIFTVSFTLYKYYVTEKFISASPWGNNIVMGQKITRSTNDKVMGYVETLSWPDRDKYLHKFRQGEINGKDLERLIKYWHSIGLSPNDMQRLADKIKNLYLEEPGIALPVRRLFAGLATLGCAIQLKALPEIFVPMRGRTGKEYYESFVHWYRYFSWFRPSKGDFDRLVAENFAHTPEHEYFLAAIKPYLKFKPTKFLSNPLNLGRVLPDFWFLLGCLSVLFLALKRNFIAGFLLLPMVINCVIIYFIPEPGVRYCYVFIPMYLVFTSIAVAIRIRCNSIPMI